MIPFINNDWPKEKRYCTSESVKEWLGLLDDTGEDFPATYDVVKKFLVPVEMIDNHLHQFIRTSDDNESLTVRFPKIMLDLINRVTPNVFSHTPFELPKILTLITETDVKLTSDPRYLRLINMVERS